MSRRQQNKYLVRLTYITSTNDEAVLTRDQINETPYAAAHRVVADHSHLEVTLVEVYTNPFVYQTKTDLILIQKPNEGVDHDVND